jgi:hypothetical protein
VGNNTVQSGFAIMMYSASSVSCLQSCSDIERPMICHNGVLWGTSTGPSPDGKDGLYTSSSCGNQECTCAIPGGGAVSLNDSMTFYRSATGTCNALCSAPANVATRTCVNAGTVPNPVPSFNGDSSAQYPSCSGPNADQCNCVLPDANKTIIPSGSSQPLFTANVPSNCQVCSSYETTVYCDSGVLYNAPSNNPNRQVIPPNVLQTLIYLSCNDAASPDCRVNSICIANDTEKTLYDTATLTCGQSLSQFEAVFGCQSAVPYENGSPYNPKNDPHATQWTSSPPTNSCIGCTTPWGVTVNAGTSVTMYYAQNAGNNCGNPCVSYQFVCNIVNNQGVFQSGNSTIDADLVTSPSSFTQTCNSNCTQQGGGAPPRACLLPWQNSYVTPDAQIPMWNTRIAYCGDSCQNHFALGRCQLATGTFDAGTAYHYQACTEIPCSTQSLNLKSVSPAVVALTGGKVTINGAGLSSSATVLVGGKSCSNVSGNSTQLTCNAPAMAAGLQDVQVTVSGKSAVLPRSLAYSCSPSTGGRTVYTKQSTFTLPSGCSSVTVKAWGAGGGNGYDDYGGTANTGGGAGFVEQNFNVTAGSTLNIYVGQGGTSGYGSPNNPSAPGGSGYTKGGASMGLGWLGGGGGGSSAVSVGSTVLAVAGGGGGGGGGALGNPAAAGGSGGGNNGLSGANGQRGGQAGSGGGVGGFGNVMYGAAGSTNGTGGAGGGSSANQGGGMGGGGGGGAVGGGGGGSGGGGQGGAGGGGGSNALNTSQATGAAINLNGFNTTPAQRNDPDYLPGVGAGAAGTGMTTGGPGLVVIYY